ncbi:MAG: GNAT family N-acetyltransferase [Intrasporangium sp.]|uniref:GNAT family N-acetyltransferase n=1 Tax=Intrasporangium sp. TaxID=1925024 RepID=UPI0026490B54|nr:GNAT family protein [Intrasporangium sp.]MDN5796313.1 GNAT family N-acetyltransferase [Intrasporangium sp.]
MNTRAPVAPATYEIRVDGHLDDRWSEWFGGHLTVTDDADGTTLLAGPIVDQAQLHGVLAGLRDIGATLLEVRAATAVRVATPPVTAATPPVTAATPPVTAAVPANPPVLGHPLHTRRLTLRPATAHDADSTWTFRRLHEVNEWLVGRPAHLATYRDLFLEPARLASTVVVQLGHHPAGTVIGDFMLRREDAWAQQEVADQARGAQAELGWVLHPAYTGHGYATEAVRALLRYSFDGLGVHRVVANCFLENESSWRLMERVGMRREVHAVRESRHRSGRWLDTVGYALLADEWRAP